MSERLAKSKKNITRPVGKRAANSAVIKLTFPDGCRIKIETRRDVDIASDPLKFLAWLKDTAAEWQERATTSGMCAAKGTADE